LHLKPCNSAYLYYHFRALLICRRQDTILDSKNNGLRCTAGRFIGEPSHSADGTFRGRRNGPRRSPKDVKPPCFNCRTPRLSGFYFFAGPLQMKRGGSREPAPQEHRYGFLSIGSKSRPGHPWDTYGATNSFIKPLLEGAWANTAFWLTAKLCHSLGLTSSRGWDTAGVFTILPEKKPYFPCPE